MKQTNMFKSIKVAFVALGMILFSCEVGELEILDNPNAVAPAQSDIDFFLNSIQYAMVNVLENGGVTETGQEVTRILHMFGPTYQNAYTPTRLDPVWRAVYSTALPDIRTMVPLAEEQELFTHAGIAKVLEAYMMVTLVDFFGDVPYSQAINATEYPNPEVDPGADIYASVEALLDDAISDFGKNEARLPNNDLYYGGDKSKWIRLANTLKLRMYLQTRLVDTSAKAKIETILSSGNYIVANDADFQFQYSSTNNNPDSRHPEFGPNFDNGTSEYMNTTFMYWMLEEKGIEDPRWRYYFYRQVSENTTDPNEQSCITQFPPAHFTTQDVFCNFSNEGFWGRIHGNSDGIPPDGGKRTTFGLYPVGGLFDDNSATTITNRNIGLQGAGISPIILASYVDFMLAEAALTIGVEGDPRTYLENGIRKSMDKVLNFAPGNVDADLAATQEDIDTYVGVVLDLYDSAATQDDKLGVIAKEWFIAAWGNGVEPYNLYRRTGQPYLQPTRVAQPGPFIRSFFYPQVFINANSVIQQKTEQDVKVFWDTNPDGFIN